MISSSSWSPTKNFRKHLDCTLLIAKLVWNKRIKAPVFSFASYRAGSMGAGITQTQGPCVCDLALKTIYDHLWLNLTLENPAFSLPLIIRISFSLMTLAFTGTADHKHTEVIYQTIPHMGFCHKRGSCIEKNVGNSCGEKRGKGARFHKMFKVVFHKFSKKQTNKSSKPTKSLLFNNINYKCPEIIHFWREIEAHRWKRERKSTGGKKKKRLIHIINILVDLNV